MAVHCPGCVPSCFVEREAFLYSNVLLSTFAHQFYLKWKDCLNTTSQSSAENPVLVGVLADKGLLRVAL